MKKNDPMVAVNMFVFGGSATLGVEKAGFKVDRVLELVDDIDQANAFHWVRNRPDVPIIKPKEWESIEYLRDGLPKDVDYVFANPRCSGLSLINRNAGADAHQNEDFYRLNQALAVIRPRAFTLENAPTLISIGKPVIDRFLELLKKDYKFTVIRDQAGNHNVPMARLRTMICGWRRDEFGDKIPQVAMEKMPKVVLRDVIGDMGEPDRSNLPNHDGFLDFNLDEWKFIIPGAAKSGLSILEHAARNYEEYKDELQSRNIERMVLNLKKKIETKDGWWDKSAYIVDMDEHFPSMTQLTRAIHPNGQRFMTTREYARIMGYPDDFIFYEGAAVSHVQCIAQGVPVQFVEWIARQCRQNLEGQRKWISDKDIVFQNHVTEKWSDYTFEEFTAMPKVELKGKGNKLSDATATSMDGLFG